MKTINYKNLILTSKGILFDLYSFKIFNLDDLHQEDLINLKLGLIKGENSLFKDYFKKTSKLNSNLKVVKINMTNFCNLKCKYCFADEGTYKKQECSFSNDSIHKFIEFIKKYPEIEFITFFGGEPLLNTTGIRKLCESLRKIRPRVSFYCQTNGTIMNDEIIKIIEEFDIHFTISIDGNEEDNDRNRVYKDGRGSFLKIKENFENFSENVQSIESTYDGLSKMDKSEVSKYLTDTFGCRNVSVCELFGESRQIKFTNPHDDVTEILESEYIPINRTREVLMGFFKKVDQCFFCSAGVQLINIDSDGKIYSCHLLIEKGDKYVLGSLNDFNKDLFELKRKEFIKLLNKKSYKKCYSCMMSWNCLQCFAAKEKFDFKNCSEMNENGLEVFETIAEEIISKRLPIILDKFKGAVKYV